MNKKILTALLLSCIVILGINPIQIQANEVDLSSLHEEVRNNPEEIRAWETNKDGELVEVTPKSNTFLVKSSTPVIASPPTDGYTYVFNSYSSSSANMNYKHQKVGFMRITNDTSLNQNAIYTQQSTITSKAFVTGNISASASIKTKFIGAVETRLSVEAGWEREWSKGIKYGANLTVAPRTILLMENYQVSANSSGLLIWNKYHSSGASAGVYTESANGKLMVLSGVNIVLTETPYSR